MRLSKKKVFLIRRIVAGSLLALLIGSIGLMVYFWNGIEWFKVPKKEALINYVRLEIQPLYYKKRSNELVVHIKLRSTQNTAVINNSVIHTFLLLDDREDVHEVQKWEHLKASEYEKEGDLVFTLKERPNHISISYFEFEEYHFKWVL